MRLDREKIVVKLRFSTFGCNPFARNDVRCDIVVVWACLCVCVWFTVCVGLYSVCASTSDVGAPKTEVKLRCSVVWYCFCVSLLMCVCVLLSVSVCCVSTTAVPCTFFLCYICFESSISSLLSPFSIISFLFITSSRFCSSTESGSIRSQLFFYVLLLTTQE